MKKIKINLKGFPGWHTECVVMAAEKLGIPFDIHCGGIDHIPIHHTNEIAQAQAAYKKELAKYWLHGEFLVLKKTRMGKSEGNIITLNDLVKKGINPLAYRYLCLTAHYRSNLTFSWQALKAAQNALNNLYEKAAEIKSQKTSPQELTLLGRSSEKHYQRKFLDFINDDLNIPRALALMWDLIKDPKISNKEKYNLLLDFDKVFGLNLAKIKKTKIPAKVKKLAEKREKYRRQKNWKKADQIRKEIREMGYGVEDTDEGPKIKKI